MSFKNFPGMTPYIEAAGRRRGVSAESIGRIKDSWVVKQIGSAIASLDALDDVPGDQSKSKAEVLRSVVALLEAQGAALEGQVSAVRERAEEHGLDLEALDKATGAIEKVVPEDEMIAAKNDALNQAQQAGQAIAQAQAETQKVKAQLEEFQARYASATDLDHVPPPYAATGGGLPKPKRPDRPSPVPNAVQPTGEGIPYTPPPLVPSVAPVPFAPVPIPGNDYVSRSPKADFTPPDPNVIANPNDPPEIMFTPSEQPDPRNPIPAVPGAIEPIVRGTLPEPAIDPRAQAMDDHLANQGEPVDPTPAPTNYAQQRDHLEAEGEKAIAEKKADADAKAKEIADLKSLNDAKAKADKDKVDADAQKAAKTNTKKA